ncbi:hypothetical protein IQ254_12745 [Nodosilinea sp. LEGE 07088]|uniref:hypothetical protein n=1 Tax=Nodosilinea sp. LEGE 07088 TaxID=2777968 RepID=UPI001882A6C3|nr:hypothetical protein [Nodosilinea sp. LEGE 07088]MBE9138046.1 hypothetical protein [Nodosilinea sp. LEGE 07088]
MDFDHFDLRMRCFEINENVIISTLEQAMQEDGYYSQIKVIYQNVQNVAYHCGATQFVDRVSRWLRQQSKEHNDRQMYAEASMAQAWILTNQGTRESLLQARELFAESSGIIQEPDFRDSIIPDRMPVLAMIPELNPRLELRLSKQEARLITRDEFRQLIDESRSVLESIPAFQSASPRLQRRCTIPLAYQYGLYLHQTRFYEEALAVFREIRWETNLIGWIRVEQAAISWIATLLREQGKEEESREMIEKAEAPFLPKRQVWYQVLRS